MTMLKRLTKQAPGSYTKGNSELRGFEAKIFAIFDSRIRGFEAKFLKTHSKLGGLRPYQVSLEKTCEV
jgi:hypothetical protein